MGPPGHGTGPAGRNTPRRTGRNLAAAADDDVVARRALRFLPVDLHLDQLPQRQIGGGVGKEKGAKAVPEGIDVLPAWRPFKDPARTWLNSFCRSFGASMRTWPDEGQIARLGGAPRTLRQMGWQNLRRTRRRPLPGRAILGNGLNRTVEWARTLFLRKL